jgi:putative peptidoglycan lipid II flippase
MQDTRTPALVNVVIGVVNVAAAVIYVGPLDLGLRGMALAHATSYVVGASVLLVVLRRRLGSLDGRRIARTAAKASVAAAASALATFAVVGAWDVPGGSSISLLAAQVGTGVAVGVLVFLISALILRVGEVDDLRKAIVRRIRG